MVRNLLLPSYSRFLSDFRNFTISQTSKHSMHAIFVYQYFTQLNPIKNLGCQQNLCCHILDIARDFPCITNN